MCAACHLGAFRFFLLLHLLLVLSFLRRRQIHHSRAYTTCRPLPHWYYQQASPGIGGHQPHAPAATFMPVCPSLLLMCIEIMSHPALVDIIVQNGPHHAQRVVDPPLRPPSKQAKPNCIRDMLPRKRKADYDAAFPAPAYSWLFPAQ